MAVALALVTAVGYGAGDFLAGLTSRRISAVPVAVGVQVVTFLLLLAATPLTGAPTSQAVGWGAVGGVGLGVGTIAYFNALAAGRMGLVATVTAVIAALVPVGFGFVAGERPSLLAGIGMLAALAAIPMLTHAPHDPQPDAPPSAGLLGGTIGGVGFGAFVIGIGQGTAGGDPLWPVVSAAAVGLALLSTLLLRRRPRPRATRRDLLTILGAGALGALASLALALATMQGLLSLVAVVAALSPAPTMLLARTVLGERLAGVQLVGVVLALVGVAAITVGAG
ncbi:EamA family transporter [Egibacter rhizosphaerae]|uniref:EamA family transporter n=1 Tax=Egibacter rhizosphaerae TaxID=1670831 RepID=A0A411YFB0_9ACTN|nr:EamA family transporter [Egibacter rhizosphaerae]QBI19802.1 EamA family transporter [Egibacter rhizosphaerae]